MSDQVLSSLICPQCKTTLDVQEGEHTCEECATKWSVREGIPVFGRSEGLHYDEIVSDELRLLPRSAESAGWGAALYDYFKAQLSRVGTLPEDRRAADWLYLLPLGKGTRALVLGCGLGTVPITLSEICGTVYAVDSSWEKIAFLNTRKRQQEKNNLYPIYVSGNLDLPFPEKYFDLISVREFQWRAARPVGVRDIVRRVHYLLKEGGIAHLSAGNQWAFQRLLRGKGKGKSPPLHTIFGYKRLLRKEGFSQIEFQAPLPDHDGIPLFSVPLEDTEALNFFLRNLFPLFEMVSPEVKRAYTLEYSVAKVGVRLALLLRLTWLAKFFVPGFWIIAKKARRSETEDHAPPTD